MAVKYRVNFGTFHGVQGNYRLDISNEDYSGALQTTYASGEVVDISSTKDYDDYSPIISSTASVTLIESGSVTYDRFQEDGNQTWKVEMLYEDPDSAGDYLVYWVGWIVAESYIEEIQTDPALISFIATDGLGDLSRTKIDLATTETEVSLIELIRRGLRKTNLGLDIYYNSGLEAVDATGTDYLRTATVHPYAFYIDDLTDRVTELERIENILQATNCRIFQSRGRWYITSWSDYNGTVSGNEENITFNVVDHISNQKADVTENVRYYIEQSSNSPDLISTGTLQNEWRDPFFSITQQIENYELISINANPLFEIGGGTTGYTFPNTTYPSGFSETVSLHGTRAVTTSFNGPNDETDAGTRWFRTNGVAPPSFGGGYRVQFSWRSDWTNTSVQLSEIRYRIIIDYDNNTGGVFGRRSDRHVWNFEKGLWLAEDLSNSRTNEYDTEHIGRAQSNESGDWVETSTEVSGTFGLGTNPRLFVEFHVPIALNGIEELVVSGTTGSATNANQNQLLNTYIDGVRILNDVTFEPAHFERNLTTSNNYTKQYETTTFLTTRGEDIFYNRLSHVDVKRTRLTEDLTLEEIVTQQRLNDYRNGGNFYRGTFVNNNSHPLSMHHKPLVNYDGKSESVGGIIDEIGFGARSNLSSVLFRVPNQGSDVSSEFNTFNVEPLIETREFNPIRTVTLDLTITGVDDSGDPITWTPSGGTARNVITGSDDGEVVELSGLPGTTQEYKLILSTDPDNTADTYEIGQSNWYRVGSLEDPDVDDTDDSDYVALPSYITIGSFVQQGRNIEIPITVVMPVRNDTLEIEFKGEADPFVADNRSTDLTFALETGVDHAMITNTMRTLRGAQGSVSFADVIIGPESGHQLDASTFSVVGTLPTGVSLLGFVQLGTSVIGEFSVEAQATNQTHTITIDGDSGTAVSSTTTTRQVTLNINEQSGGITNVSLNRSQIVLSGFVGQRIDYDILGYAADGWVVDPDNFSVNGVTALSWLTMGDAYGSAVATARDNVGGGESIGIPLSITIPSDDATGTVTVNGNAQRAEAPTVDVTVNFTGTPSNSSLTETSETFTLNPGQSLNYVNNLLPNDGYEINGDINTTETDTDSVVDNLTVTTNRFGAAISMTITAPQIEGDTATTDTFTASIALTGTIVEEPWLHTVSLSESLPNGKLNNTSLTKRFGLSDTTVSYSGVTISPVDMAFSYPNNTTFTVTGGSATNYTYGTDGSVTFDLTITLPTFDRNNPRSNVSTEVAISTATTPSEDAATSASFTATGVNFEANGPDARRTGVFTYTSNGAVDLFFDTSGASEVGGSAPSGASATLDAAGKAIEVSVPTGGAGARFYGTVYLRPAGSTTNLDSFQVNQDGADDNPNTFIVDTAPTSSSANGIYFVR